MIEDLLPRSRWRKPGCGYDATPPERAPDRRRRRPRQPGPPLPRRRSRCWVRRSSHLADASGAARCLDGNRDGRRCGDACEQVWPPVTSDVPNPSAGPGVDASAVGTVQGGDGRNHVTYGGEPLYRYAGDRGARTTTGNDVEDEWGRWRLVTLGEGQ